jgi:hypothetical protein
MTMVTGEGKKEQVMWVVQIGMRRKIRTSLIVGVSSGIQCPHSWHTKSPSSSLSKFILSWLQCAHV